MKLNNKGWGFREMFFLMGILFCFLLVAIYLIYQFYDGFENKYPSGNYTEVSK